MVFKYNQIQYKELTIHRPTITINNDTLHTHIPDLLDEIFRLGATHQYDEHTHKNLYFYMEPNNKQFIGSPLPQDYQDREEIKKEYLSLLEQTYSPNDGYLYITEEIFGIDNTQNGGYGVRAEMSNTELKNKLLNRLPINQPLTLCTLQVDEIIPRIVIIEPVSY